MSEILEIDGIQYHPAPLAAKQLGYTKEYLLMLAKQGKIDGHKQANRWYINISSAEQFFKGATDERKDRRREISLERKRELQAHAEERAAHKRRKERISRRSVAIAETAAVLILGLMVGFSGYAGVQTGQRASVSSVPEFIDSFSLWLYRSIVPAHTSDVILTEIATTSVEHTVSVAMPEETAPLPPSLTASTASQTPAPQSIIIQGTGYAYNNDLAELISIVAGLTRIVGVSLTPPHDQTFIHKQADAIYDSLDDSVDNINDSIGDTNDDLSMLTADVDDIASDLASLSAFVATSSFAQGGNAFGHSALLGTTDNQPLSLITNGAERLTITADGKIGIGTTAPTQTLSVDGSGYVTGGLGIGVATTTSGVLQTASDAYIGGNLTVIGNSTVFGASSADSLVINSSIKSDLVPDQNITYDLGSPSFYWDNAYVGTLNANNIAAANTTISGTQNGSFVINSDNVTADTEDAVLNFFRGAVVPNALITWNSTLDRFEFNQPTYIENAAGSVASTTLTLKGVAGQTADILSIASSIGNELLAIGPDGSITTSGNVGIGTTTPGRALTLVGMQDIFAANTQLRLFDTDVSGYSYIERNGARTNFGNNNGTSSAINMVINDAGNVGIGTTAPVYELDVDGDINVAAGSAYKYNGQNILTASTTLFNYFFGTEAGNLTMTGAYNTAEGYQTLSANTTGTFNTAMGYRSLITNTTGGSNVAVGVAALRFNTSGSFNTATGLAAMEQNTTGANNTANGYLTLRFNTTGSYNSGQGMNALYSNTTGTNNSAQGYGALYANTTGSYNSALGSAAGLYIANGTTLNTTSNNSLYLGANTKALAGGDTNETVIGYNAIGAGSDSVTLGNSSVTKTLLNGNIGIGTTTPASKLTVAGDTALVGNLTVTGSTSLASLSLASALGISSGGTGLSSLAAGLIPFGTGTDALATSSSLFFDAATRRLGVGTNNPTSTLDVRGIISPTTGGLFVAHTNLTQALSFGYSGIAAAGTSVNQDISLSSKGTGDIDLNPQSGNVVISSASANTKLHLVGLYGPDLHIEATGAANPQIILEDNNNVQTILTTLNTNGDKFSITNANGLLFNTSQLVINSAGNVGIGTTNPSATLEVAGTAQKTAALEDGGAKGGTLFLNDSDVLNGVGSGGTLLFGSGATNGSRAQAAIKSLLTNGGLNGIGDLAFSTRNATSDTGLTERMRITSSGNVGIGTTTPTARLDVTGAFNSLPARFLRHGTYGEIIRLGRNGVSESASIDYPTDGNLAFSTVGSERLRINSNGNVGIGTTSPIAQLHISTGGVASAVSSNADQLVLETPSVTGMTILSGASSEGSIFFGDSTSATIGRIIYNHAADDLSFWTGATKRLTIASNGNVGIGTTTPGALLDVWGAGTAGRGMRITETSTSKSNGVYAFTIDNTAQTSNLSASGAMAVDVNSGRAFTINGLGNVGIGTNAPGHKLSIVNTTNNNSLNISHTAPGFAAGVISTDQYGLLIDSASASASHYLLRLRGNGGTSEVFTALANGNVGLGIASPSTPLDVRSTGQYAGSFSATSTGNTITSSANTLQLSNSDQTANNWVNILSNDGTGQAAATIIGTQISDHANNYGSLNFWTRGSTGSGTRMTIDSNGNIGIGSTIPTTRLTIVSPDVASSTLRLESRRVAILAGNILGGIDFASDDNNLITPGITTASILALANQTHSETALGTDLTFSTTNGTTMGERMRILGNGNIGIGATDPHALLDLRTADDGAFNRALRIGPDNTFIGGGSYLEFSASQVDGYGPQIGGIRTGGGTGDLIIRTGGNTQAERLRITDSGNIGIGTTNPTQLLEVSKAASGTVGAILNLVNPATTTIGNAVEMRFAPSSAFASRYASIQGINKDGSNNIDLAFLTGSGATINEKMRIMSGGNVGIGTTNPQTRLDIRADNTIAATSTLRIGTQTHGALGDEFGNLEFYWGDPDSPYVTSKIFARNTGNVGPGGGGAADLVFATAANSGAPVLNDRLVIKSSGTIGIGTTTPSSKLHVVGTNNVTGGLTIGSNTGTSGDRLAIYGEGNSSAVIQSLVSGGTLAFRNGDNAEVMRLVGNNTLAIGTTTPAGNLHVYDATGNADILAERGGGARVAVSAQAAAGWIGTVTNHDLGLATNSSTRLTITAGGNVGIGTTNPSEKLHISGDSNSGTTPVSIRIADTNNIGGNPWSTTNPYTTLQFYSADASSPSGASVRTQIGSVMEDTAGSVSSLAFYTQTAGTPLERMRITSTGNVGIGTTSPAQKLHVEASASGGFPIYAQNLSGDGSTKSAVRGDTVLAGSAVDVSGYLGGFTSTISKWFGVRGTAQGTASAAIVGEVLNGGAGYAGLFLGGNVGIGTTTPGSALVVNGRVGVGGTASNALLEIAGNTSSRFIMARQTDAFGANISLIPGNGTNNSGIFANWGTGNGYLGLGAGTQNQMVINQSGYVGIGTTSPTRRLDVWDGSSSVVANLRSASGDNSFLSFSNNSSTADQVRIGSTAGNLVLSTNFAERMRIDSSGNVGIGTTTPAYKLDVNGDVNVAAGSAYKLNGQNVITASTTLSNYFFGGAGNLTMTGTANTATGYYALASNTTGSNNTANGYYALASNTTGSNNTANGNIALFYNTTGAGNVANGYQSLINNTTGYENAANGTYSMAANTIGNQNTGNGYGALYANTTGSANTGFGHSALFYNTTGSNNTANGYQAGRFIADGATGNATSNNSLYLGANTKALADGDTNEIVIGYGAIGNGSNSVTLGNTSVTKTILQGNVGIGTTSPASKLTVEGGNIQLLSGGSLRLNNSGNTNYATIEANALTTPTAADLAFSTGGVSNALLISNAGNVGIGTTNPNATLEVAGTAQKTAALVDGSLTGGTLFLNDSDVLNGAGSGGTLLFGSVATNGSRAQAAIKSLLANGGLNGVGDLAFSTRNATSDTNLTERMRITSTGNIGIGTTSPSATLDVWGNVNIATGTVSTFFADTSIGRVGIGTSTPSATLDVEGTFVLNGTYPVGTDNVAVGSSALASTSLSGGSNTAVGKAALMNNADGGSNTAVGWSALTSNISGNSNTALGYRALFTNSTGASNVGVGLDALRFNTSGSFNTVTGLAAMEQNTTGLRNTANGYLALRFNEIGNDNVGMGYRAAYQTTGSNNIAVGNDALWGNESGSFNTAVGHAALNVSTGGSNTALGFRAGSKITSGTQNIVLGYGGTTGITTGSNNIIIGQEVRAGLTATGDNQLNIGNLIFGTGLASSTIYSTGNVGIGTNSPTTRLTIVSSSIASSTLRLESPRVAIVSGDILGGIDFASNDTTLTTPGTTTASILAIANTTHTASALGTDLAFRTTNGTVTSEQMRILGNGNVGIGTTSPQTKLHISGDGTQTIRIHSTNFGNTDYFTEISNNFSGANPLNITVKGVQTFGAVNDGIYGQGTYMAGFGNLQFATGISGTFNTANVKMVITNPGNVGIGTSTPVSKLAVYGPAGAPATSGTTDGGVLRVSSPSTAVSLDMGVMNTPIGYAWLQTHAWTDHSVEYSLAINPNGGNVGIGTTTPSTALHISSSVPDITYTDTTGDQFRLGNNNGVFRLFNDTDSRTDFVVTGGGNVGIGTTTPGALLTLSSSDPRIRLQDSDAGGEVWDIQAGVSGLFFVRDGTTDLALGQTGNTSIGTTTSLAKLTVDGSIALPNNNSLRIVDSGGNLVSVVNMTTANNIQYTGSAVSGSMQFTVPNNSGAFQFSTGATPSEKMRLTNTGFLGIGTTTPSAKLDVWGNLNVATGTVPTFFADTSIGRVGIGNAIPSATLDIAGTFKTSFDSTSEVGVVTGAGISTSRWSDTASTRAQIGLVRYRGTKLAPIAVQLGDAVGDFRWQAYDGNALIQPAQISATVDGTVATGSVPTGFSFLTGSNSGDRTERLTITSGGNVGIGTTTPQRTLHVVNAADGAPVRFEDANGYCEIDPTSTTWTCTSDRRLKENIKSLDNAEILSKLAELRPVNFAWKSDATHAERTGLIAQEVEALFPDLVSTDSITGYKSVAYGGFTTYLLSGVGQLAQERTQIAALFASGDATFATTSPFYDLMHTDSVWSRLVTLAQNFIDGILTVSGLHTNELCVGDVCVDEATFLKMVQENGGSSAPTIEEEDDASTTPPTSDDTGTTTDSEIGGGGTSTDPDAPEVTEDPTGEVTEDPAPPSEEQPEEPVIVSEEPEAPSTEAPEPSAPPAEEPDPEPSPEPAGDTSSDPV